MDEILGREAAGVELTQAFRDGLKQLPITFGEQAAEQLAAYHALLTEANAHMNLTGNTDLSTAMDRLYLDSLTALRYGECFPQNARAVDVGTGAGIPGMILAIARPDMDFLLLDALGKRIAFLEDTAARLGLKNVRCLHIRAEDAARKAELREHFDLALARAVAPLNVLCELLLPLVKIGGQIVCYKGPSAQEELSAAQTAAKFLGGGKITLLPAEVPTQPDWAHCLAVGRKVNTTPKAYPRKAGTPERLPLGVAK